ncbi:MAG: hypothetical protein ABFD89_05145, partial [Bryobacteraceae bacterium]
MKLKLIIIGLVLLCASSAPAWLSETNIDVVSQLVYVPWGTNHYNEPQWWVLSDYTLGAGTATNSGGSVSNWAMVRAFNANFRMLERGLETVRSNYSALTNSFGLSIATNTPDGQPIPWLAGTNNWTGPNDFPDGGLTIGGIPVYPGVTNGGSGSGGGSNGPLVISVSPSRIRGDESVTLKVSGSGFDGTGMYIAFGEVSQCGTLISSSEIDVDIYGGYLADGVYDVSYHAANGAFTLFGGLRVGPDAVSYATNAGSAGKIDLTNTSVL